MRRDFSSRPRETAHALRDGSFLVAGLLTAFFAVWEAAVLRGNLTRARADLQTLRAEIASEEALARKASSREAGVRGAAQLSARVLQSVGAPPPRVVAELAALLPADVRLTSLSLAYGEHLRLEMKVEARSSAAYDVFLDRVQRSPLFTDVLPGVENRDGPVSAVVKALYRGEGAL